MKVIIDAEENIGLEVIDGAVFLVTKSCELRCCATDLRNALNFLIEDDSNSHE